MSNNNTVIENNNDKSVFDWKPGNREKIETGNIILYQNDPNPFDKKTSIRFFIPESGVFKLLIHNNKKEVLSILQNGHLKAGTHNFTWDGRSMTGRYVEGGRYNYTLVGKGFVAVRKLIYKTQKSTKLKKIINSMKLNKLL